MSATSSANIFKLFFDEVERKKYKVHVRVFMSRYRAIRSVRIAAAPVCGPKRCWSDWAIAALRRFPR